MENKRGFALVLALAMVMMLGLPALAETPAQLITPDMKIVMYDVLFEDNTLNSMAGKADVEGMVDEPIEAPITRVQTLSEALMLLTSGRVDAFVMFYDSMRYIAARNEGLFALKGPAFMTVHMIADLGKEDLMADLDAALIAMEEDGTLDALWQANVEDIIDAGEPVPVTIPVIEGAPTYKVGLSGDCPPMDFTTADGKPAGFNTAVLAELSERMGVNFELVVIDSGARYMALKSGAIDIFFWHQSFAEFFAANALNDLSGAEEVVAAEQDYLLSHPYHTLNVGWLLKTP